MYSFTKTDFNIVFEKIWETDTEGLSYVDTPSVFVLGGLPGSGKSRLTQILSNNLFQGNVLIINGDEYREYHPNYSEIYVKHGKLSAKYSQPWVNLMVEKLILKSKKEKFNVIIEGTFRTSKIPITTLKDYKKCGFRTGVAIIVTHKDIAWKSTKERFKNSIIAGTIPRAVAKDDFDHIAKNISTNIETVYNLKIADKFYIFDRNGLILNLSIHNKINIPIKKIIDKKIGNI